MVVTEDQTTPLLVKLARVVRGGCNRTASVFYLTEEELDRSTLTARRLAASPEQVAERLKRHWTAA